MLKWQEATGWTDLLGPNVLMIVTVVLNRCYGLYSRLDADFTLNINADVLNVTLFFFCFWSANVQKKPHKVGGDTPMVFYSRKQTDKGVTVVAALAQICR